MLQKLIDCIDTTPAALIVISLCGPAANGSNISGLDEAFNSKITLEFLERCKVKVWTFQDEVLGSIPGNDQPS